MIACTWVPKLQRVSSWLELGLLVFEKRAQKCHNGIDWEHFE
jgi:hypothetical protein